MSPSALLPVAAADHLFDWQGLNAEGQGVQGQSRAAGAHQLAASLRSRGIRVQSAQRVRQPGWRAGSSRIRPAELGLFTRQLAVMLQAGLPLLQALRIAGAGCTNPAMVRLAAQLSEQIETGTALSAACRQHPRHFSALYGDLVEAGEASGMLDTLLERLARYLEKSEALKSKIKSALMYPTAVLLVALGVVAVILVWVVPSFQSVFASYGADLPTPTLIVMAVSEFLLAHGLWLLLGSALLAAWLLREFRRRPAWQAWRDRVLLKLPLLGTLIQKACTARWARTLATLYAAGVPLVEALGAARGAAGNAVFDRASERIREDLTRGISLNAAMRTVQCFPAMAVQMCAVGEESGSLDRMLGKVADFYEAEVDDQVAGLSSLLEPVVMVVLGTLVGALVVALYLPIFKLGQLA